MKITSVNIGKTKPVLWQRKTISTAIFKQAVKDPKKIKYLGMEGDEQADPRYHGGVSKAVYSYDELYYTNWKKVLTDYAFEPGNFGETLTTQGLTDDTACIGNIYEMGTSLLQVTEPRFPCSKLNVRFNNSKMVKLFTAQLQNGIYYKVLQEGFVKAGDEIVLIEKSPEDISITQIVQAYYSKGKDKGLLNAIINLEHLPNKLKNQFISFT